jgi:hypothetical protein
MQRAIRAPACASPPPTREMAGSVLDMTALLAARRDRAAGRPI